MNLVEITELGIPRINWPNESGTYKVVQLDMEGQPYLRFADRIGDDPLHTKILESLFSDLDRDYPFTEVGDLYKSVAPALESDWYKVHGMGKADVNLEKREATFKGISYDYNIEISESHLNSLKPYAPEWKFVKQ